MRINSFILVASMSLLAGIASELQAHATPNLQAENDSLRTPVFENKDLNAAVYAYKNTLDVFLVAVQNGTTDAFEQLRPKLSTVNDQIMQQAAQLPIDELDQLQLFLDQYATHIQSLVDLHFKNEIAKMEAAMKADKQANELELKALEVSESTGTD